MTSVSADNFVSLETTLRSVPRKEIPGFEWEQYSQVANDEQLWILRQGSKAVERPFVGTGPTTGTGQ